MIELDEHPPPCRNNEDLFFGPTEDGREEAGRDAREGDAKLHCFECPYRMECLHAALAGSEDYGVWGGMGEGERRRFKVHLRDEGYDPPVDLPDLEELRASVRMFYRRNTSATYGG